MEIHPYLSFNGNCEAALKFYEKSLGGKTAFMVTYGESPMAAKVGPEWTKKILHATFMLGDHEFGCADAFPGQYEKPQGISVTLDIDTPAEAERVFKALAQGGEIQMEIQETFWAKRFAMCVDQFGIPWMINCGKG